MEEKAMHNFVERIGESIVWGLDQEVSLLRFDNWKVCYVRIKDGEDMVAEIDRQEEQGHNGAGTVVSIDWNDVVLEERADLVIAPIADIKLAKLFGIPVEDRDKEKDDTSVPAGANPRNSNPRDDADILQHMMEMGADDVDDADENELVNLYDKKNHVIEVGKLCPNMVEFRICFKTYAVNHDFEAKTLWTDRKKFHARRKRAEKMPPLVVEQCCPVKNARLDGCTKKRRFNPVTEPILEEPEQTEHVLDAAEEAEPIFDAPE
ncbi:hypothetical protein D1007_19206 [Hordeum vulgare]|nr:hypothetical protein D1007_19206 [Hordeum vulgare]